MRPGVDPKVDYAFKRLFGSEEASDVLIHMLNAVLRPAPGHEVVGVTLLNPFNERETAEAKLSVLDVKARDASGRLFNVEMQNIAPPSYPSRILYYWSKLYGGQLEEGDNFDVLRPTISISFLNNRRFADAEYHHVFRLRDEGGQVTLTDDMVVHVIELPKFDLSADQLTDPLQVWCYFLRHGEQLDTEALPAALDIAPVRRALEVLGNMTQNDRERELYEGRLKARRDQNDWMREMTRLSEAVDQATAKLDEALAAKDEALAAKDEAAKRGDLIGRIRLCQRFLKQAVSSAEELATRSLEDLERLAGDLESQAFPPG